MANISRCFEQFHGFNNSMFFQEKKGKVEVTICDMASKVIYSSEVPNDIFNEIAPDKEDVKDIKAKISKFLNMGYKPQFDEIRKRIFLVSPTERKIDYSSIKKSIDNTIAFMEPQVSFEPSESSHYTCPITHMLLKDPVVDIHGHTFEREAIERCLDLYKMCPLERKPMDKKDLKPNYFAAQTMERLRKTQFAVPARNAFEGRNEKLAKTLLDQGFVFEQVGKHDEALDFYRKALKYTNQAKDYLYIPVIFEKMKENQSACLAYLYLAKYQIEENNYEKALESLIKARDLQSHDIELNNPIALFHKETGRNKEAFDLFMQIGDRFAKTGEKMALMSAIDAYKNAISVNPDIYEVYLRLADLIQDKQQKANVFLTAANHFMK
ncbi:MAG: E3 ubiquitin-protein ligase LubX, partial [Candidatus Anoxychlamydiales bacterium]|nr:E3 ubiquitin-protein ligase LubX [Candidatus Anoxychlamydiales bacterium]